MTLTAAKTTQ